jgi:hypothetical protein
VHQRFLIQVLDPAREQVGRILVEEMQDGGKPFAQVKGGGKNADGAAELPGYVWA